MITTTLLLSLLLFLVYREIKKLNAEKYTTHYRSADERTELSLTNKIK